MIYVLTKEESEKHERKLNEWWLTLDSDTKSRIRSLMDPWLERGNCHHDWRDNTSWLQDSNKMMEYCLKCGWNRIKTL